MDVPGAPNAAAVNERKPILDYAAGWRSFVDVTCARGRERQICYGHA